MSGGGGHERFLEIPKIACLPSGCWLWTGTNNGRYGQVRYGNRYVPAQREVWEYFNGPVPAGLILDHLCRVGFCVNPSHLEPVTPRENTLRGIGPTAQNAQRISCVHGHPFDAANTYFEKSGARACRACNRERWRAKHRAGVSR